MSSENRQKVCQRRNVVAKYCVAVAALGTLASLASAADVNKADNTNDLNLSTSWLGGLVPGVNDIAVWDSTVTGPNSTLLGANQSWLGLRLTNPGGPVTIGGPNVLTLGTGGIDLSAATQSLAINSSLTLGQGRQNWNVATGQTLTISGGTFARNTGSVLVVDRSLNTGTIAFSPALTNGIIGPWAIVRNSGAATNNGSGGYTFATVSGGNVAAYTGAASMTGTNAWGGIPSGGAGTINYDISSGGTLGATGLSRSVNTLRYTGSGATQPGNVSPVGNLLTANGIMNAGTGTFAIGGTGGTNNLPINITIGSNNELVLAAMSSDLLLRGGVLNGAVAGAVTVVGENTVTLAGVSSYTGATTVAGGTLAVTGTGSINTTSGIAINGSNARYLHTSSVAGNKAITLNRGALDGVGSIGGVTVADLTSNTVANGNGATGALTIASLAFGGDATVNVRASNSPGIAVTGALSTSAANGTVVINPHHTGIWAAGLNNLISFGSFGGSISDFSLGTITGAVGPRFSSFGGLVINGNNIALNVIQDKPKWTGAQSNEWSTNVIAGAKNWQLVAGGTPTDFYASDDVLFDDSASTFTPDISVANVTPLATTFNNSLNDYTLNGAFGISSGTLTKSGSAALSINNANTYSGGTTVNGGRLNINNASAIGTGALTIAPGSAKTLDNTSGAAVTYSTNIAQNWNDDFAFAGTNDLNLGTGTVTIGGSGTVRTVNVSAGTMSVGRLAAATHSFTKNGAGTLQLNPTAASSIGGTLTVNAGTLGIGAQDMNVAGLAGNGTIINGSNTTRWVILTNAVDNTFAGTLANGSGTGRLGLRKFGAGTLTLSGNNTYTDNTWIDGGTLVAASPSALGNTDLVRFSASNTTLVLASDVASAYAYPVTFGTGTTINLVADRATLGAGIDHSLTTQALNNGIGGGQINVMSGVNVDQTLGLGRITFNQLGMGAGSAQTTLINPTTANVTIGTASKQNNNVSQTLGLGGTSQDNIVTGAISNGPPLTGSNSISVTKSGTSKWTLKGISNYTGATLVSGGVLTLANTGAITSSSSVTVDVGTLQNDGQISSNLTVNSGGTLSGNGTFAGNATIAGVVAPGNSIGTLTWVAGNVSLGDGVAGNAVGATSNFEVATGGSDQIALDAGTLTYDGVLNINLVDGAPTAAASYTLFDFTTTPSGDFDGVNLAVAGVSQGSFLGNAGVWTAVLGDVTLTFTGSTGVLDLSLQAVPEPLTAAGVLLLSGRLLGRRNRVSL